MNTPNRALLKAISAISDDDYCLGCIFNGRYRGDCAAASLAKDLTCYTPTGHKIWIVDKAWEEESIDP